MTVKTINAVLEAHEQKSAVSGSIADLTIVRLDATLPLSQTNAVVVTTKEASARSKTIKSIINVEKNPEGGGGVVTHVKIRPPTYKGACREQLAKGMHKRQKTTHPRDPIWGVWPRRRDARGHVAVLQSSKDATVFYALRFPHTETHSRDHGWVGRPTVDTPEGAAKDWLKQELVQKRDTVHKSIEFFEWLVGLALFAKAPENNGDLTRLFKEVLLNCRIPEQWDWGGSSLEEATGIMATTNKSVEDAVGHLFGYYGYARSPQKDGVVTIPRLTDLIRAQHLFHDLTLATDEHDRSKADWIEPTMHPHDLRVSVPPYHTWQFSLIDPADTLLRFTSAYSNFSPHIVISTNANTTPVEDFQTIAHPTVSFREAKWKAWTFRLNGHHDSVDPTIPWKYQPGFNTNPGEQTVRCYQEE